MLKIVRYSKEDIDTKLLYHDVPNVVQGCLASGCMPEVNTQDKYEEQLYNLITTVQDCDVFVAYANDYAVAFCAVYSVDTDAHCAGTGLIQAITLSTTKHPKAIPLLLKHIKNYAVCCGFDWLYTSKKIDAYTYQGKYNLLRRKHG